MVRHQDHDPDHHQGHVGLQRVLTASRAFAVAALALLAGPGGAHAEGRPFLAYHASWYEVRTDDPAATTIARLPPYITHLALAFARPDLTYKGGLDLAGTGLQYPYSGAVLKAAIARLKARAPQIKVLVSVGGWNYPAWDGFDADALARLVKDLGADGVDIDFETHNPACARGRDGRVACPSDALTRKIVEDIRRALPRPFVVSAAGWSVGAYGEGAFATAAPQGPYAGVSLVLLRPPVSEALDLVSIMSYDAGPAFRPEQAFRAYRVHWKGPLALGIQVMPGTTGGPRFTLDFTARTLAGVMRDPRAGAMLYALLETPPGPTGPDNPDFRALAVAVCVTLELRDCAAPVP
ncbi:glycoside hydrolase family 18 protein [Xanthobacter sp. KR7-225]|uniref:glycoside hydrolase family 18 protein n=1 Tax=Xanthobacter sp. KR7-225 TaxID=3156613 RepID=UPI0032B62985